MKHLTRRNGVEPFVEVRSAVRPVAYDGASKRSHVDANLMRPASLNAALDYRDGGAGARLQGSDDLPVSDGVLPAALHHRHTLPVHGMATYHAFDSP